MICRYFFSHSLGRQRTLFFFNLFIVFILFYFFGCDGPSLLHEGFSCGERGLLFITVHGLLIVVASLCFGAWALGARASVAVHRLSCSTACGIFPDQGSNLCPLHWQADSEPLRHQGSPKGHFLDSVLWRTKVFNFDKMQFICFIFSCLCFWCQI